MDTHFEEMDTHDPAGAEMDTHDSSETTVGVHIVSGCPHCQCQWVSTLLVGVHIVSGCPRFGEALILSNIRTICCNYW